MVERSCLYEGKGRQFRKGGTVGGGLERGGGGQSGGGWDVGGGTSVLHPQRLYQ